ncbi:ABC transporter ATPase [Sporosarcina sp. ANT_H38]|uniref:ABC transporter ATPase n=1 Tax=Sporosarcina sp. ANT_H38 TaxID=2597358 RepID=UPI0011F2AB3C|nr:ABC transporter ATPase [Sporosarcina sp. ANT_H38]KAA0955562.1 ABC transporter ATPase [Sporosarcina sp. ANT_H38]
MLKSLTIDDVDVLREPLVSGRQSPNALGGALVLGVFMQILVYYLEYTVLGRMTNFPFKDQILTIHFWITVAIVILSVIYAIPLIYKRSQKTQYLVSILVSQNIAAVSFYICGLFLIGENQEIPGNSLLTLSFGVLLFTATVIRFSILLGKGKYRSKRDELRAKFEKKTYIPAVIIGSTAFLFIIQFIVRTFNLADIEDAFLTVICFVLFYTMIFVLPEQLVILYCKFRFKSFNFDKRGYLDSEDSAKGSKIG